MCGRYTMAPSNDDFESAWPDVVLDQPLPPRYNIAPTQSVPVILNTTPKKVTRIRWGLIPAWAKDPAIGSRMINARAESVPEKPSFKRPFARQRCLFLADGFYEWKQIPGQKARVPYHIRLQSGQPFAFAGLWDRWVSPAGEEILSGTIITTTPNPLMEPIHNRMPVLLSETGGKLWLAAEDQTPTGLMSLLVPFPPETMEAWPVSARVNQPEYDQPDCRRRIAAQMDLF